MINATYENTKYPNIEGFRLTMGLDARNGIQQNVTATIITKASSALPIAPATQLVSNPNLQANQHHPADLKLEGNNTNILVPSCDFIVQESFFDNESIFRSYTFGYETNGFNNNENPPKVTFSFKNQPSYPMNSSQTHGTIFEQPIIGFRSWQPRQGRCVYQFITEASALSKTQAWLWALNEQIRANQGDLSIPLRLNGTQLDISPKGYNLIYAQLQCNYRLNNNMLFQPIRDYAVALDMEKEASNLCEHNGNDPNDFLRAWTAGPEKRTDTQSVISESLILVFDSNKARALDWRTPKQK